MHFKCISKFAGAWLRVMAPQDTKYESLRLIGRDWAGSIEPANMNNTVRRASHFASHRASALRIACNSPQRFRLVLG
jgi:hypothetical protein